MYCDSIRVTSGHQIEPDFLESLRLSSRTKFLAVVCHPATSVFLPLGLAGIWCPLSGEIRFTTADYTMLARKGSIYTSDSQRHHEITIPPGSACIGLLGSQHTWSQTAQLCDDTARHGYALFPALHQVNLKTRIRLLRLVREVIKEPGQTQDMRILSLLATTLRELQQDFDPLVGRCPGHSIAKRRAVFLRLQRARNHMSFRANCDLSVKNLAIVANYSVWRFIKVFDMVYGETPYSFMSRNRIDRAASLLKGSDLAIGDIAIAAGFDSRASFSRAMKRRLGSSASDFRDTLQRKFIGPAENAL
jgi:AraC family transcriptional regulator